MLLPNNNNVPLCEPYVSHDAEFGVTAYPVITVMLPIPITMTFLEQSLPY